MAEMEKFEILKEGSSELEQLKSRRRELNASLYEDLDSSRQAYEKLGNEDVSLEGELSKLDHGLNVAKAHRDTIAQVTAGLTTTLGSYTQFVSESKNFQGPLEKMLNLTSFTRQKAEDMRESRLKTQAPEKNLQQVLDYADQLVVYVLEERETMVGRYNGLQASVDVLTQKIAEYQPREAALSEQLGAAERQFAKLEEEFKAAGPAKQNELGQLMNTRRQERAALRHEYDQVLTIYSQAQQALQPNIESRDALEQIVRDLGRQATMIREKVDNVTEIYATAPDVVQVMLSTKGMAAVDKAVNKSTSENLELITAGAESIADETLGREEIQLVPPEEMFKYSKRMAGVFLDFAERQKGISDNARLSLDERYNMASEDA